MGKDKPRDAFITINRQRAALYADAKLPEQDENGHNPLKCIECGKTELWRKDQKKIDGWSFGYTHQICDPCRAKTGWDEVQSILYDAEKAGAHVGEPDLVTCRGCHTMIIVVAREPILAVVHRRGFCAPCAAKHYGELGDKS